MASSIPRSEALPAAHPLNFITKKMKASDRPVSTPASHSGTNASLTSALSKWSTMAGDGSDENHIQQQILRHTGQDEQHHPSLSRQSHERTNRNNEEGLELARVGSPVSSDHSQTQSPRISSSSECEREHLTKPIGKCDETSHQKVTDPMFEDPVRDGVASSEEGNGAPTSVQGDEHEQVNMKDWYVETSDLEFMSFARSRSVAQNLVRTRREQKQAVRDYSPYIYDAGQMNQIDDEEMSSCYSFAEAIELPPMDAGLLDEMRLDFRGSQEASLLKHWLSGSQRDTAAECTSKAYNRRTDRATLKAAHARSRALDNVHGHMRNTPRDMSAAPTTNVAPRRKSVCVMDSGNVRRNMDVFPGRKFSQDIQRSKAIHSVEEPTSFASPHRRPTSSTPASTRQTSKSQMVYSAPTPCVEAQIDCETDSDSEVSISKEPTNESKSFRASFARRSQLDAMRAAHANSLASSRRATESHAAGRTLGPRPSALSAASLWSGFSTINSTSVPDLLWSVSEALAEVLDQSVESSNRLRTSLVRFAPVFAVDENIVLAFIVRETLNGIEAESKKDAPSKRNGNSKPILPRRESSMAMSKRDKTVKESSHDTIRRERMQQALQKSQSHWLSEPGCSAVRRVILGLPQSHVSRHTMTGINPRMKIVDSRRSHVTAASAAHGHIDHPRFVPVGPLVSNNDDETVDLQLPLGITVLAVVAVLSRMDCALRLKRRKSRTTPDRRTQLSVTLQARARLDRSGRTFSFGVTISGSSPTRVTFRRPMLVSLRKIDDYVDIVVDTKQLIMEFCEEIWGRRGLSPVVGG